MLVGYVQSSPWNIELEEETDPQYRYLSKLGCEKIFVDELTLRRRKLLQLRNALEYVRPDDALITWKLSFLGESTKQHIQILKYLKGNGIGLRTIKENIDSTADQGQTAINSIISLEDLEKRQLPIFNADKDNKAAHKEDNGKVGRPPLITEDDLEYAKNLMCSTSLTIEEIAKGVGVSVSTLYRHIPNARKHIGYMGIEKKDQCYKSNHIFWETLAPDGSGIDKKDLSIWNKLEAFELCKTRGLMKDYAMACIYYFPPNFTKEQNIELIRQIINQNFTSRGLVVSYGINLDADEPHVHIQISKRPIESNDQHGVTFSLRSVGKSLCTPAGFQEVRKIFIKAPKMFMERVGGKVSDETEELHSRRVFKFSFHQGNDALIQSLLELPSR